MSDDPSEFGDATEKHDFVLLHDCKHERMVCDEILWNWGSRWITATSQRLIWRRKLWKIVISSLNVLTCECSSLSSLLINFDESFVGNLEEVLHRNQLLLQQIREIGIFGEQFSHSHLKIRSENFQIIIAWESLLPSSKIPSKSSYPHPIRF